MIAPTPAASAVSLSGIHERRSDGQARRGRRTLPLIPSALSDSLLEILNVLSYFGMWIPLSCGRSPAQWPG
jgi:hypothetical protein